MKRDYPDRPITAVGVVVLKADKVLLVQRAKPPKATEWSLPGGAQHVGETLFQAAIREVEEETGLRVQIKALVDVVDFIDHDSAGKPRHHYTLVDYWAESAGETVSPGDDAADAQWVALASLEKLPIWSETKRIIHKAVEMRRTQ